MLIFLLRPQNLKKLSLIIATIAERQCTPMTPPPPVQCDFCDNVYCYKCSEISSKAQYKKNYVLKLRKRMAQCGFCRHCRTSVPGVKKMTVRVTKVEETQSQVLNRLDSLEKTTEGIDEKIKEAIQEQKEVDIRKLSVMCFGLRESTEESQEERNAEETEKLKRIITYDLELSEDDFPLDGFTPIRIGQPKPNRVRPIRFEAKTVAGKKKLLQMARTKLKDSRDSECKDLYFKPDLTKKQRAEAFTKRERRRAENVENQNSGAVEGGAGGGEPFHCSQSQ